ncbi:MAG: hypothetical protein LBH58_14140 [Tannerellaceae bacterium]|jgi:hypothetical protein|nr:hypothetical protein [Tannerellaceae bacterium]
MKLRIYLFIFTFLLCGLHKAFTQEDTGDFVKRFYAGSQQFRSGFESYVDSVNLEFAKYLARNWELFKIEPPEVRLLKPAPQEMPVYIPGKDEQLPTDTPAISAPDPEDTVDVEVVVTTGKNDLQTVVREESEGMLPNMEFFGTPLRINPLRGYETKLLETGERQIAAYWTKLAKTNYKDFINDLNRKKNTLELSSWGLYCLICEWADTHFDPQRTNEKVVFTVYMLNQAGYKAKIGRLKNSLVVMMAFKNTVYGKAYIRLGGDCYYILSEHTAVENQPVASYKLDYGSALSYVDLRMRTLPRLTANIRTMQRTYKDTVYTFSYDHNLMNFYNTFPQTELNVYAATPLSPVACESMTTGLARNLQDKDTVGKLKFLLSFVQHGFAYQTDEEQFGREKFFFPEEMLSYPYSDCEDRAMLFCHMVKLFCGLDTLLIEYPTHVAAAVKLDISGGDAIVYNNERYIVCDPTYIGAPIARTMKGYNNATAKIIALNF